MTHKSETAYLWVKTSESKKRRSSLNALKLQISDFIDHIPFEDTHTQTCCLHGVRVKSEVLQNLNLGFSFSPLQDWDIQIFLSFSVWQFAARSFENPNKPLKDWNDAIMKVVLPPLLLRLVSRQADTQIPALCLRERALCRGPEVSIGKRSVLRYIKSFWAKWRHLLEELWTCGCAQE